MSPIFTFIVITLGILAIFDIIVGVANDAVNFLNSAIGSKIAPRKVILSVAAIGILVGTLTSTGMMEIARSGVFYPAQFDFSEIMMLFLGMIVGDIVLLNVFNSLGLPTSTTVSMVFGLLGAAVAISLQRIAKDPAITIADISQFINSGKAMMIIAAILLSVVLAFIFGIVYMYISRLIFSFKYSKIFTKFGALWCGISLTGIIYFSIFKGLKGTGIISPDFIDLIHQNTILSLFVIWICCSILLGLSQLLKINILRITILSGTFSLALAFAGNDLVNFIGVPLAGYDSYQLALNTGDMHMLMGDLMKPAKANFLILAFAGVVMVLTLFFSKKAMHVTQTELSLSNQNSGNEKFGSTRFSRGIVRAAMILNKWYIVATPKSVQRFIDSRFVQLPVSERGSASYDLIRATVNLTAASILISVATSYKLPLSTTYVVFMVAMGSSLADKAWGRESAVYRITGVLTVISGWFITAFAGFTIALTITSVLIWGGWIAAVIVVLCCLAMMLSGALRKKKRTVRKIEDKELLANASSEEVLVKCTQEIIDMMEQVTKIYNRTLVAVFKENRKVLKEMVVASEQLAEDAKARKYGVFDTLRLLQNNNVNTGHFYVQVVDYMSEVTKALLHITRPAFDHIDNNHEGFSKEQIFDLMAINGDVEHIFDTINEMMRKKQFDDLDKILEMRDNLFYKIADAIKNQLRRSNEDKDNDASSTRKGILYLNLLTETKTMVLQARNLIKSQSYFIIHP